MGSIKHSPGCSCCIGSGGSGSGSGSGDDLTDNFCARSYESDWDGDELSPLALTFTNHPSFPGNPFVFGGCPCSIMNGTFVLPYAPTLVSRPTVGHAWEELFDLPGCSNSSYRISLYIVASVRNQAGNCQLHVCRQAYVVDAGTGVAQPAGTAKARDLRTFIYNAGGSPVDLATGVAPTFATSGVTCAGVHPLTAANPTWSTVTSGNFQYCFQNYTPILSQAILT